MENNKLIKLIKFLYKNSLDQWPFGEGQFVKHIDSINIWVNKYSSNKGMFFSNKNKIEYPEVTGYWLETLINWGYSEKAETFFNWLILIQNSDGGWPDYNFNNYSVFFDSSQVIRGIKYYSSLNEISVENTIKNYLSYFSKNKEVNLVPRTVAIQDINWHLINLQAAWIVHKNWPEHISLNWLTKKLKKSFSIWEPGHQNAHLDLYILEAMYELGIFPKKFKENIRYFDKKVKKFGFATCDKENNALNFTGSVQLGVLYYKIGRKKDGDKLLFNMLEKLNFRRGNWRGSEKGGNYFPKEEISWNLKYFLDMLHYYCLRNCKK